MLWVLGVIVIAVLAVGGRYLLADNDRRLAALIAGGDPRPEPVLNLEARRALERLDRAQDPPYQFAPRLPAVAEPVEWPDVLPAPVEQEPRAEVAPRLQTVRRPRRTPSMESDVMVPLAQALTAGIIAALLVLVGLLLWEVDFEDAVGLALLAGLAVTALAWLNRLGVVSALLWEVEEFTGLELTGDDVKGRPDGHLGHVNPADARTKGRKLAETERLSDEMARFRRFVEQLCALQATSERALGIQPGTAQRDDYVAFRDRLMRLGLAEWKKPGNPNAGWTLVTWDFASLWEVIAAHTYEVTP